MNDNDTRRTVTLVEPMFAKLFPGWKYASQPRGSEGAWSVEILWKGGTIWIGWNVRDGAQVTLQPAGVSSFASLGVEHAMLLLDPEASGDSVESILEWLLVHPFWLELWWNKEQLDLLAAVQHDLGEAMLPLRNQYWFRWGAVDVSKDLPLRVNTLRRGRPPLEVLEHRALPYLQKVLGNIRVSSTWSDESGVRIAVAGTAADALVQSDIAGERVLFGPREGTDSVKFDIRAIRDLLRQNSNGNSLESLLAFSWKCAEDIEFVCDPRNYEGFRYHLRQCLSHDSRYRWMLRNGF